MKRIHVKENQNGLTRYYYANWQLTFQQHDVIYRDPTFASILKDHGEKGATLYLKIFEMAINFGFVLVSGYLKISRSPAIKWPELEPQILEAIREVYGDYELEREPSIKRVVMSVRRLFAQD